MYSGSLLGEFIRVFSQLLSGEAWSNHYSIIIFNGTARVSRFYSHFTEIVLSADPGLFLSAISLFKMQPFRFDFLNGGLQPPQLEYRQYGYE